jgi:hypothetical protein
VCFQNFPEFLIDKRPFIKDSLIPQVFYAVGDFSITMKVKMEIQIRTLQLFEMCNLAS